MKSLKSWDEGFYTKDYDQEMLDFIDANYNVDWKVSGWSDLIYNLCYSERDKDFYLIFTSSENNLLTKEEFKRKIGMIPEKDNVVSKNTFTKSNLVAGTHVVEIRDGSLMLLVLINGEMVAVDEDGYVDIKDYYREDLKNNDHINLDIMKVYSVGELGTLEDVLDKNYLTLEWQRPLEKTPSQLKLEDLQQRMEAMHEEMNILQKSIEAGE